MSKKDGKFEKGNKASQKYNYEEVAEKLIKFIEDRDCPIIAEFAYLNDIPKSSLYEMNSESVKNLIKKCTAKKEFYLESKALSNDVNPTMAIFSLKQLGWSDKIENTNKNLNLEKNIDEEMTGEEASLIYSSIVKNG